jgi:hypothetical protein
MPMRITVREVYFRRRVSPALDPIEALSSGFARGSGIGITGLAERAFGEVPREWLLTQDMVGQPENAIGEMNRSGVTGCCGCVGVFPGGFDRRGIITAASARRP